MPLPNDDKVIALSEAILKQFETIFGAHPGFRPAHAKGTMFQGAFTGTTEGRELTRAEHVTRDSVPVLVRFSNSTGLPTIPDTDPNADPRGMGVRFMLGEHVHTDIVAHSTNAFMARTGEEFLGFLQAVAASDPKDLSGSPLESFLGTHPAALKYVQTPKPVPASYATEAYFGLTAMKFTNKDGVSRYGRYRLVPEAGVKTLDDAAVKAKGTEFLMDEIKERVAKGPVRFKVMVQVAEDGDPTNDVSIAWPDYRRQVELGTIELTGPVADSMAEQKQVIFDPIPRLDGIEPSDDPLLELRAAVYLISGRRRRQA
jgi:catalase